MEKVDLQSQLISIILPVYNGEKYLSPAIESCLAQTHKKLELIIVNDASTDDSLNISNYYSGKDNRVKIFSNPINKKLPASLNIGHSKAKGKFVTWTSHDNLYAPNALEKLLASLISTNSDIVYSNFEIINSSNLKIGQYNFHANNTILLENIVGASFLYRFDVFRRNNGYNEDLFKVEDYAFWLMASLHSKFHHLSEDLYSYRNHSESLTASKTISQFSYEKQYGDRVEKMYKIYFDNLEINNSEELAAIFKNLHLHQELDVKAFLKSFRRFRRSYKTLFKKYGKNKILKEIDLRIRHNILRYRSNQNLSILFFAFLNRPKILYSYSKKKSIKIIYKCIF